MRTIGYTGHGGAGSAIVQKLKHGRKWHARSRFTGDGGEGREGELWVFADRRGKGFGYQRSAFSHQRSEIGGSTALILPEKQGLDGRSATGDGFGRRFRRFSGYGWVPRLAAKRAESAQSAARPSRRRWRWLLLRGTTRSVGDERWDALDDRYGGGSRREARLHRACRDQLSAISFQPSAFSALWLSCPECSEAAGYPIRFGQRGRLCRRFRGFSGCGSVPRPRGKGGICAICGQAVTPAPAMASARRTVSEPAILGIHAC
jgi:hypothetical protein